MLSVVHFASASAVSAVLINEMYVQQRRRGWGAFSFCVRSCAIKKSDSIVSQNYGTNSQRRVCVHAQREPTLCAVFQYIEFVPTKLEIFP